ncbi:MAG: bifunctional 3'-5' exonuclease/DNA polymerase [Actinomycetales bacterium]|nr:bifunctional 3'-5' exonuclease/DNA polymerase [Actinomycetales bacterium]
MDHVALTAIDGAPALVELRVRGPEPSVGAGPAAGPEVEPGATTRVAADGLAEAVRRREAAGPVRWVWESSARHYPPLLAAGVRVERCHDLRLARRILRSAPALRAAGSELATAPADAWDAPAGPRAEPVGGALFELEAPAAPDPVAEFARQRAALAAADADGRLALLLSAESVGSLVAEEMRHAGLPWDAERHDAILTELLGPRPPVGARPAHMEELVVRIREALDDPAVNPDSPVELVKRLQNAGLAVRSTSRWELKAIEHPVIAPLLEYKSLQRLHVANGWHWVDEWVHGGRFRPVYVPGGVVTGRWASDGGGALQIPKAVRGAVVADPGWSFVVADAAQLEPRVLAALSRDDAMAAAGRAQDLYTGMVDAGVVETREQAKYGMLGAIYGGTTGESARVLPRLRRAYPRAMALVEEAARAGERGEAVATHLGRGSPRLQAEDWDETRSDAQIARAQQDARAWGRFTRNFVVQGTAAEWALCWMGALRRRLAELGGADPLAGPHLVFFLHDELVVHSPAPLAEAVAAATREAAAEAGRLLFGAAPVEFALSVAIVQRYADAT